MADLKTVKLGVDETVNVLQPRTFSSGKKGWGFYGKITLKDGTIVQASVNLVIPHSENQ